MKPGATVLILTLVSVTAFAGWSSSGPTGGSVNTVVVAPSDPAVIWAGDAAGVFRSIDGGTSWTNVSGLLVDVGFLAVDANDPNKAWAAAGWESTARVWRTTDGGATWTESSAGLPPLHPSALYVDPRDADTLYLGSQCGANGYVKQPTFGPSTPGVFKSTDGGATWRQLPKPPTPSIPCGEELAIDPFSPWRVFHSGAYDDGARQFESFDGGESWEIGPGPRPTRAIVFDARYPFTHYGITSIYRQNVMVSQDGGFTWSEVSRERLLGPAPPLSTDMRLTSLSMDPERSRIFFGTTDGIFRSGNGGSVWASTPLRNVRVNALGFGGTPPVLFAATANGLLALANRGLGAPATIDLHDVTANVSGLAVDPSDPSLVFAGVRDSFEAGQIRGRVFRSGDRGASWQRLAGDDDTPKADVISVGADGRVYALRAGVPSFGALYVRGRDDKSWTMTPVPLPYGVAADPKNAGVAFLAQQNVVQRTRDGGLTWQNVASLTNPAVLAIDPSDPRWVYVGDGRALQRSSDGGDTWTTVNQSYTGQLIVAPSNGNVLYRSSTARANYHVERSDDRGATWRALALPEVPLSPAIAVDPRDADSVWVAQDAGLYHSSDGGVTWQSVDQPFLITNGAVRLVFDPSGRILYAAYPNHGVWQRSVE
jgi:photosystem II stability/assembly factor-like uncharacterized protein